MKTTQKLLLAAVVGIGLSATYGLTAGDEFASPRARANEIKVMPGTTVDRLNRSVRVPPPKVQEMQATLRKEGPASVDKLDRSFGAASAKLRERRSAQEFQVAPLK